MAKTHHTDLLEGHRLFLDLLKHIILVLRLKQYDHLMITSSHFPSLRDYLERRSPSEHFKEQYSKRPPGYQDSRVQRPKKTTNQYIIQYFRKNSYSQKFRLGFGCLWLDFAHPKRNNFAVAALNVAKYGEYSSNSQNIHMHIQTPTRIFHKVFHIGSCRRMRPCNRIRNAHAKNPNSHLLYQHDTNLLNFSPISIGAKWIYDVHLILLDICQFWYTATLFQPVKSTPKAHKFATTQPKLVKMSQNRPKFCVLYAKTYTSLEKVYHRRLCGCDKYQLCI